MCAREARQDGEKVPVELRARALVADSVLVLVVGDVQEIDITLVDRAQERMTQTRGEGTKLVGDGVACLHERALGHQVSGKLEPTLLKRNLRRHLGFPPTQRP